MCRRLCARPCHNLNNTCTPVAFHRFREEYTFCVWAFFAVEGSCSVFVVNTIIVVLRCPRDIYRLRAVWGCNAQQECQTTKTFTHTRRLNITVAAQTQYRRLRGRVCLAHVGARPTFETRACKNNHYYYYIIILHRGGPERILSETMGSGGPRIRRWCKKQVSKKSYVQVSVTLRCGCRVGSGTRMRSRRHPYAYPCVD